MPAVCACWKAPVLSLSHQREEACPAHGHHRALRHQVLLRTNPAATLAHAALCATAARVEVAGGAEPGRGTPPAAGGAHSRLSRLPDHHLCLRLALAGRNSAAGAGCGQWSHALAHPWQEQERPLCAAAAVDPAIAARSLAHASFTAVVVSRAHAARAGP